MQNKVKEYIEHTEKASAALQELLNEAKKFAEENRELVDGEVVDIYADGQFICEGVIGGVKSRACTSFRQGGLLTMKYYLDEKIFNEAWNSLSYEVFAKKKDGVASTKHALADYHFIAIEGQGNSYDYYIRRKTNVSFSD
jgi:hypothetical protein